jgi:hypothetical protein
MTRRKKPYDVPIDKTTMYDTITSQQWHKFRDEELEKIREEKPRRVVPPSRPGLRRNRKVGG